ncbi:MULTISPECIES: type II toxin-antitoxin system RelE/ParE family toxin [Acidobacteriaceae]|uniref:type II toxin-antitoxin system RelE/ParE family toxin n=1 Tax=Acidobacteriaceae TaxID=204434 RepID=UPI00131B8978|nr:MULTISPECIES: type II toxin-antitoxin system RelE/ParE family toxin [Acidobacteriaceae]MDW5265431.1 type II toxin-antitoxin system RelE/ParE family toxin [Edaphobacter sp.]
MIRSFRHVGLEKFYKTGLKKGINAAHANKLNMQLTALNVAKAPADMNLPGYALHSLHRELLGHWSIKVNGNWRLTFKFEDEDVILLDYQDYH